jgi:hypothetical protein
MPRGRPNADHAADPKTNKMEAVRRALGDLTYDASPSEIQTYIKDKFDVDMNPNMISSYKSTLRDKAGIAGRRRKKKRGRPKKVVATANAAAAPTSAHDAVTWKDLRTIKDIAGRLGKRGLRDLVELLD